MPPSLTPLVPPVPPVLLPPQPAATSTSNTVATPSNLRALIWFPPSSAARHLRRRDDPGPDAGRAVPARRYVPPSRPPLVPATACPCRRWPRWHLRSHPIRSSRSTDPSAT